MDIFIKPLKKFDRGITAPPDKSITHRAIMFSAFSEGRVRIFNALLGEDCLATVDCVKKLGAQVGIDGGTVTVQGMASPRPADLYVGNSGTTMRLLAGMLAGREQVTKNEERITKNDGLNIASESPSLPIHSHSPTPRSSLPTSHSSLLIPNSPPSAIHYPPSTVFTIHSPPSFTLDGDASVRSRPMNRVIDPLRLMGAKISGNGGKAPLTVEGARLHGIHYVSPVASAQVKSAILLAGLNADGATSVTEPQLSRDHTERMLRYFGADVSVNGLTAAVRPSLLTPRDVRVPGDISGAAFPLVLAAGLKGGRVAVRDVGVNPTRDGILRILSQCGVGFRLFNRRGAFEPVADIELEYAPLKPFRITQELVPLLIDEIPVLAVLACFIEGESIISGAEELKVKESNRIDTVVNNLKKMGADIEAAPDGMVICGKGFLEGGAEIDPMGDHRIAMSMAIAGALSKNGALIKNAECASVSYPGFYEILRTC